MVAQALPRQARASAFARAMARARAEQLVAYPNQDGTWTCKPYTIVVTGRLCDDVACSCQAGSHDNIYKYDVCVVVDRKWGVRPVRPTLEVVRSTAAEVAAKAAWSPRSPAISWPSTRPTRCPPRSPPPVQASAS